jgi:hypothetical protein
LNSRVNRAAMIRFMTSPVSPMYTVWPITGRVSAEAPKWVPGLPGEGSR